MAFDLVPVAPLGGGLNLLAEESKLAPGEFRELLDVSLEDGETLQAPPGDTRLNTSQISVAGNQRVVLLAEFNKSDGTRKRYAKVGDSIVEWTLAGVISAPVTTGLTVDDPPGWTVHQDKFILADQSGNQLTNGTVWGPLGNDAPAAPGVAVGAAGVLNGAYQYRVSRYSTILVEESSLSVASAVVNPAGNQVNVSGLTALDAVWDRVRVYRTLAGGSTFFLHSERASAANFADNTADGAIAGNATAPATDTVRPPPARFAVVHLNRLFLAGFYLATDVSALRMSEPGIPYRFPAANRLTFAAEDGDRITGLWTRGTRLFIAKQNRIFELLGDDTTNFEIVEVEAGRGVHAQRTTTTIGDREFILDTDHGPFSFSSASSDKVGQKVLPAIRRFNEAKANLFVGGHEPMSRAWWLSVFSTASVTADPDVIYAYHYERGAWAKLRLPHVTAMATVHDSSERLRLAYGTKYGFVHLVDADGNALRTNLGGLTSGVVTSPTTTFGFTSTSAGIVTTGNGWLGAFVTVVFLDANRQVLKIEQREVSGNFGNSVAVLSAFSSAPQPGDLWFLGGFFAEARTGKLDLGDGERRKHVPYFWVHFLAQDHSQDLYAALVVDDENASDDTRLANFTQLARTTQQLPALRGGGGRRPTLVAVRVVAVSSNQPYRVKGFTLAARRSAFDRPKTA